MLTVTEIRTTLEVGAADARNIQRLLALAEERGRAGRWPQQRFEHDPSWQRDGHMIDRTAIIAGIDTRPLFELYRQAHAAGLERWRKETN